jgi:ferritin
MKRIQIQQRKNERPEFVVMRAYMAAFYLLDDHALDAMVHWMFRHASDHKLRAQRREAYLAAKSSVSPQCEVHKLPVAHQC